MKGKLYVVATPIGNLEDISFRALKTLQTVDIIAAEDTRHTLKLLNYFNITKPLMSYYRENEKIKSQNIIKELLKGKNVAIVSDAGTPGISDPGEEVIKKAIENEILIIPIPGACAAINALICSGLSTKEFCFLGFLSTNKKEKIKKLEGNKYETKTLIIYEAPHKLIATLQEILQILGDRDICLAKEITKIHETFLRGKISEILEANMEPKGEYIIIIDGAKQTEQQIEIENLNKLPIQEHYAYYEKKGLDKKEIIKHVAKDRGVSKNEIYKCFVKTEM